MCQEKEKHNNNNKKNMSARKPEPLLATDSSDSRFTIFPIKHHDIWKMYKKHLQAMWVPEEIYFSDDMPDWENKLTPDERKFILHILAFFAASDGIVLENLLTGFTEQIKWPEVRAFYTFQATMENIHSETYSLFIETYVSDEKTKNELFDAINTNPSIKAKADWALKYADQSQSFTRRLVAFSIVEGLFFSSSFCAIFWLKKRGLLPGLCQSNEFICRDEGLHFNFACLLYGKYVQNKLSEEEIHAMIQTAVDIEIEFVTSSVPVRLIGMNSTLMKQYVQFIADFVALSLGCTRIYNVTNPFDFMKFISLQHKANFFERPVSNYSKAKVQLSFTASTRQDDNFLSSGAF